MLHVVTYHRFIIAELIAPQISYNKNQLSALISQIYFGRKLYMFRTVSLSIISSFSLCTQEWCM